MGFDLEVQLLTLRLYLVKDRTHASGTEGTNCLNFELDFGFCAAQYYYFEVLNSTEMVKLKFGQNLKVIIKSEFEYEPDFSLDFDHFVGVLLKVGFDVVSVCSLFVLICVYICTCSRSSTSRPTCHRRTSDKRGGNDVSFSFILTFWR